MSDLIHSTAEIAFLLSLIILCLILFGCIAGIAVFIGHFIHRGMNDPVDDAEDR